MKQRTYQLFVLLIIGLYVLTHVLSLTALPVFADESIYIRWAQLLLSDPHQYFFFALNDGKTPLFIWSLAPFLKVFADPLLASRLLSVGVGVGQALVVLPIIRLLGGSKRAQLFGALGVTIVPFWFFHHRMALMDGMLTLFLSLYFWMSLKLIMLPVVEQSDSVARVIRCLFSRQVFGTILLAGLFLGLAFLTKLPAVLFIPSVFCLVFLKKKARAEYVVLSVRLLAALVVGLLVFSSILVHPAAGQLFSRGSDFLFSAREIRLGYWLHGITNIPSYVMYFLQYLTPEVLFLVVCGLLIKKNARTHRVLFIALLFFFLPIAVLGKVVYPRYYLPVALFVTVSAALVLDDVLKFIKNLPSFTSKKLLLAVIVVSLLGRIGTASFSFMYYSLVDTNKIPFVSADRTQYLTEWSSGHGITEVVALIEAEQSKRSVAVATEGFFGTLPDGLLMYFENKNHENVLIEGIGQPVAGLPDSFIEKAREYDTVWLVVNDYRLLMNLPPEKLVYEYCRPYAGPCLQVWDVGEVVAR